MVRRHRIAYHEKKLGPTLLRRNVAANHRLLLKECAAFELKIRAGCSVTRIMKEKRFLVSTTAGDFECESLVIATGGLSIPKIGATDFGYRVARQFGLRVIETRPALVPLTLDGEEGRALRELSGVSFDANVQCDSAEFRENILFTHHGLSGPAILQISSYWKPGNPILIEPKNPPRRFLQKWRELYGEEPIENGQIDSIRHGRLCQSGSHAGRRRH